MNVRAIINTALFILLASASSPATRDNSGVATVLLLKRDETRRRLREAGRAVKRRRAGRSACVSAVMPSGSGQSGGARTNPAPRHVPHGLKWVPVPEHGRHGTTLRPDPA